MSPRTVSEDDLERLKREQEAAGREYNEALTAVDHAIQQIPERPAPPPGLDESRVNELNEQWTIVPPDGPPIGTGWRAKLRTFIWRLIEPSLSSQQRFNSVLVDHVNRNIETDRQLRRTVETTSQLVHDHLAGMASFQSMLVQYLQRITPFVDTKDYELTAILRRLTEDNRELLDVYKERIDQAIDELRTRTEAYNRRTIERLDAVDERVGGLAAGVRGVGDELLMRSESMAAREARFEARVSSLSGAHAEIQTAIGVMQQALHTLRRRLESLPADAAAATTAASTSGAAAPGGSDDGGASTTSQPPTTASAFTSAIDSYKYVGFEDRFRGDEDEIRSRVREYLPLFQGADDVLDVGCGRGEFLDVLREEGIGARGLDINHEMVQVCRERGHEAEEGDALGYLLGIPDESLGGLFAAQVVEHLAPDYLIQLIDVAFRKLRPGARIVLETINPACWFAFFESYIRDLSHVRPVHPDTLEYFLLASGFQRVEVRYRAPYPEHEKLKRLPGEGELIETFNANAEKLNRLLFTYLDYAAVGERVGG